MTENPVTACSCGCDLNDHIMRGRDDEVFGFPITGPMVCPNCDSCDASWGLGPEMLTQLMSGTVRLRLRRDEDTGGSR